jgi:cytochrome c peroxidase
VNFESGLFNAQIVAHDSGNSRAEGADGGAETLADQARVAARFDLFDAWQNSDNEARRSVFRGQELFNTRPRAGTTAGTCRACHSVANGGQNAAGTFFNVRVSDGNRRQADQPLYTLENNVTHVQVQTTDPGLALITGKFADIGKFKVPGIRALGARAPYFHSGSANTLLDVVRHYESALNFVFTPAEEQDMVAFLSAL